MSASGAGVLQLRSVEYARNHGVRIHCRSSFTEAPGTFVVGEEETMERPLITAVTHSRDEARLTLLGVPDHPGVSGPHLHGAGRRQHQRRHDHPGRARRRGRRGAHVVHGPAHGPARGPRGARSGGRRGRHPLDPRGPRDGQGLGRRRGHEVPPRRRREGLHDARRAGHQHRDDLDVPDQDLVRRHRRLRGPRRARAARGVRARRRPDRGRAPLRSPHELSSRRRWRHRRRGNRHAGQAEGARLPGRDDRPVRLRALGGQGARRRALPRALRRVDPGLRPRALQRGRDDLARVGAEVRRRRRGRRRQLLAPSARTPRSRSWSPRSTRTRSRATAA